MRCAPALAVGRRPEEHVLPRRGALGLAVRRTSATWTTSPRCRPSRRPRPSWRRSPGCRPRSLAADRHPATASRVGRRAHAGPAAGARPAPPRPCRLGDGGARLDGSRPVIGVAFDGTGYGDDGAVWGGEVLLADYDGFTRAAHLALRPAARRRRGVRNPYRMALSHLRAAGHRLGRATCPAWPPAPRRTRRAGASVGAGLRLRTDLQHGPALRRRLLPRRGLPPVGVRGTGGHRAGGAALTRGRTGRAPAYAFALAGRGRGGAVHRRPGSRDRGRRGRRTRRSADPALVAARFHQAVADLVGRCARGRAAGRTGLDTVALTGGVFLNALLTAACAGSAARPRTSRCCGTTGAAQRRRPRPGPARRRRPVPPCRRWIRPPRT